MKIGLVADSNGDIAALDSAIKLLLAQGAERLFFLGGRYNDVDELINRRRAESRGHREYGDDDFLQDVASFLDTQQTTAGRLMGGDDVERLRKRFSRVPCKDSLEYRDLGVPRKLVEMVGDVLCCLVHDKGDLSKDDMLNATLLVHGKSPDPGVVQIGPRFFVTPGRLTGASEQTCALMEIGSGVLRFNGLGIDGRALKTLELPLGRRSKISVT